MNPNLHPSFQPLKTGALPIQFPTDLAEWLGATRLAGLVHRSVAQVVPALGAAVQIEDRRWVRFLVTLTHAYARGVVDSREVAERFGWDERTGLLRWGDADPASAPALLRLYRARCREVIVACLAGVLVEAWNLHVEAMDAGGLHDLELDRCHSGLEREGVQRIRHEAAYRVDMAVRRDSMNLDD